MSNSLSVKGRVCSVMLAGTLACGGMGVAAPAFAGEQPASSAMGEMRALAPSSHVAPSFEKNKSYTVNVDLHSTSGGTSVIAGLLEKSATIDVDNQGDRYLTLRMAPGKVFGQDAYASDLKLFKEGESDDSQNPDVSKFAEGQVATMASNNSLIVQIKLPYLDDNGNYRAVAFSGFMNKEVVLAVDWSSMKQVASARDRLKALKESTDSLNPKAYYGPSWKAVHEALVRADDVLGLEDEAAKDIVPALQQLEWAVFTLRTDMENPFKAGTKVFLDVYAEGDVDTGRAIKREAVVETDAAGTSVVTVVFNNQHYSFLPGNVKDFVVKDATILDSEGAPGRTVSVSDNGKDGVAWKFVLPYNSPSGYYQVQITSDLNGKKASSLRFDWATIRDHADFRALEAALRAVEEKHYDAAAYTPDSFAAFEKALAEAKRVAGDKASSQEAVDVALEALNAAITGFVPIQNQGRAQTVNLGISAFNAPYDGSGSAEDIGWAGSRVAFGKDASLWRVLDADQGIIMRQSVLSDTPFTSEPSEDDGLSTEPVTWEKSKLRAYLNGDYYKTAFSDPDRGAIAVSIIDNETAGLPQARTEDNVYVLSKNEFQKKGYGFYDDTSRSSAAGSQSQFTRTPGNLGIQLVTVDGLMEVWGSPMEMPGYVGSLGSSPVVRLKAENVLLTTPVASAVPSKIEAPVQTQDNVWKLTLVDPSRAFDAKAQAKNGSRVIAGYTSGATDASQISALVVRSDGSKQTVRGYGTVASKASAQGKVAFDLPADFDASKDKVYLFSETIGQGAASNIASAKVELDLSGLPGAADASWSRLWGDDAFGTMKSITSSSCGWADGSCDTVVLATSGGYWDALSAAALAGVYGCPVLITDRYSLTSETKAEIERLGAKNVFVCGGDAAVSDAVVREVDAIANVNAPVRLWGDDAQQTAVRIAQQVRRDAKPTTCVIATSAGFYDALSVSPWAYSSVMPVYLTDASGNLGSEALADIRAAGYTDAVIVGGTAAISANTQESLSSEGGVSASSIQRLAGGDAWKTSAVIAERQIEVVPGSIDTVGIADGNGYWDALTGAALIGKAGGVMLLVPHNGPNADGSAFSYDPHAIDAVLGRHAGEVSHGFVFGGTAAVPQSTMDAAKSAAKPA